MSDISDMVAVAQELISENGRSFTLQHPSTTPLDATKPWRGPGDVAAYVTLDVVGVFVRSKLTAPPTQITRRGQETVLVAPTANADDLNGFTEIVDGGQRWIIETVNEINPGGTTVLWEFTVKK